MTAGFANSVIKGIPASSIPDNALADSFNIITSPVDAYGRTGSQLWSETPIPSIEDRDGYTAEKSGNIITATAPIFIRDDVSNFFVWPGTEEEHDEISGFISATQVRTTRAGTRILTSGCRLVGKTNVWDKHKTQKKWVFMFGQDIYVSDLEISAFIKCLIISRDIPQNAISGYCDFDDKSGLIFNSGGIFRIDFSTTVPKVYRINIPIPNRAIPEVIKQQSSQFQYHYLYSASRLGSEGNIRDRLTPCDIEHETGTNIWGDDYQDFSEIWTDEPIGQGGYTYGKLTCGPLAGGFENIGAWIALGALASFDIAVNGEGPYEVAFDPTDIGNMVELAETIEAAMRDFWIDAECDFDSGRLVLSGGRVRGGSISYVTAGGSGVDVSASMCGTYATGARVTTPGTDVPKVVGPLYVPNVENTDPEEFQWHLTHFPIWRTKDLNNQYKLDIEDAQYNDPNGFILAKELRICAAFWATRGNGIIIAHIGEFEQEDVGSTIEWEDGTRDEIVAYINSTTVAYTDGSGPYYNEPILTMAAEIGNGRVMRATQTGNTVTRTHGGTFTPADERKTITWANGYRSYILEYVDANTVIVEDNLDKITQGFTIDPVYRHYCDICTDKTLETRKTTLVLKQRFWQAIESGNVGIKIPGLVFVAKRGTGELSWGQVPDKWEHLCGFHDKAYQITKKISDDIQFFWLFKGVLTIWTSSKTWRWAVDSYEYLQNANTKDAILVITGLDIVDEDRGCFDWGSMEPIGDGNVMLLTNEPSGIGWRAYNGFQYGPNVLEVAELGNERFPEFRHLQRATRALYDGMMGLMIWGRKK